MAKNRGWNFCPVGFSSGSTTDEKYKRCLIHRGTILVKDPQDDSVILCPECGLSYEPDELETITGPVSRFKNKKGKMLIQADKSKKKKMVSEQGDIIPDNDEDIKMDLARGHRVLAYKESLPNVEVMKK